MLTTLVVLTLGAIFLQATVFATNEVNGSASASGAPPPAASQAASASASPSAPAADVLLQAKNIAFVQSSWVAPANKAFTIALDNQDQGTPHNVALKNEGGQVVWQGTPFNGVATQVYNVPPQPAGKYTFMCTVHPSMTGNATLE